MSESADKPEAPAKKRRIKDELRVPKYEGPEQRAPIPLMRARAIVGTDVLTVIDDNGPPVSLESPIGKLGEAEEQLGRADPQKAVALLADVPADVPADVDEARKASIRARAALMAGDVPGARSAIGNHKDSKALAAVEAMVSLAEGDVARATERIGHSNPRGLSDRYAYALIKVAEGDIQEATDALIEVARSAPWHAVARYQLGQLFLATGDPARAGTLFEMAWVIAPTFVAPSLTLAEMLADSRQYGEALTLVSTITERAPDAHAPRVLQLRILVEIGERDAALVLAQMLRERAPGDAEVSLLYAEALSDGERRAEALAVLDDLTKKPGPSVVMQRAHRLRARIALAERPSRAADALVILKEASALEGPLSSELAIEQFHVAWALGQKVDAEAALDLVEKLDEPSSLISGAILARSHALWPHARRLAERARAHVVGSPAEPQLEAFLQTLP